MAETLVLNSDEASKAVRNIAEYIENIGAAATLYKQTVEEAFQRSDLSFLNTIATAMGKIETNIRQLSQTCDEIQDAMNAYIREFVEYSEDSTGLE